MLQDLPGRLAADIADAPFQAAHAGLAGVIVNDRPQGPVGDRELLFCQPVFLHLLPDEIFFSDMEFFILRIAADLDELHPVQKRAGNGLRRVGGSDK